MKDGYPGLFDLETQAPVPPARGPRDPGEIDNLPDHEIRSDLDLSSHPDRQTQGAPDRDPARVRPADDRPSGPADMCQPPWPEGG